MKQKIIVVLGPTAVGKSDLAVLLAEKLNGEVISADSRQVYKGLNIGTGKITEKEMRGVPHHLLNVADPHEIFTVSDFIRLAENVINEIAAKGKIPIICGGTGFYIQALVDGTVIPEVPPNDELRKELSNMNNEQLFNMLKKLDDKRAETIDRNNPRRLVRAIEIATALGNVPPLSIESQDKYDATFIGLNIPSEELKSRINTRLLKRLESGMLNEAEKLHSDGLSWERMDDLGLEYRYMARYLQGKITKTEMVSQLNMEIWHYAKRQMTWFKRDKRIKWFRPTETERILEILTTKPTVHNAHIL